MKILIDGKEVSQEDYICNLKTGIINCKVKISHYAIKKRKWWQFQKPKYGEYIEITFKTKPSLLPKEQKAQLK